MNFISSLLDPNTTAIETIITNINTVVTAVLGILTLAVIGYAIFLAYKFFTADSEDKRKNTKAQLIYAIIGVVVLLAIIIIAPFITQGIKDAMTTNNPGADTSKKEMFQIFFPKY